MKTLKQFLGFCIHEWENIEKIPTYDKYGEKLLIGNQYIQQCKKCKKIRSFKV